MPGWTGTASLLVSHKNTPGAASTAGSRSFQELGRPLSFRGPISTSLGSAFCFPVLRWMRLLSTEGAVEIGGRRGYVFT